MYTLLQNVSLSGTPMHLSALVDAPNRALSSSIDENFDAGLEPSRAFVCSYPIDGILRASGQRCGHMDGILSDNLRAFMDQTQLCCKKPRSSQHHPCFHFQAMINLQPRIRRPRHYSSRADGTPAAPASNNKRHALISALVRPFIQLPRLPFNQTLPLPARFWPSGALLLQTTLARSFLRETTVPSFLDDFNTVWPSEDSCHNLHFVSGSLFLLGPYNPLQI